MELFSIFGKFALNGIGQAMKDMASASKEGKQVSEVFSKTGKTFANAFKNDKTEAVVLSMERLTTRIYTQQTKVDLLKQKYSDLVLQHKKLSPEAIKTAAEISKLSKELDKNQQKSDKAKSAADKFDKSLKNTGDSADKTEGKISKLNTVLGKIGGIALKGSVAAIGAAAAGITALTKSAVENYAEYEQLVGGAELMFGDAFSFIEEKSKNAYSTVQMSQNDYLQQVNGFATGLKTALGGNAQAAAELADRIITAEADVVAATGTSQEAVQNAFNGIMKSNYTMLDNLQLGITPTKEGFQEVIDKVNEWNTANGNATKYQIENLADCQNALVDYIEMQGLAGYAADEASKTIQGSLASTKAAWQNWLTGTGSIDALVDSVVNSAGLLANAIGSLLPNLTRGISQLVTKLAPQIPPLINQLLPSIIESITTLISSIGSQLPGILAILLPVITQSAPEIVNTLIAALISSLPVIVSSAGQLILALAEGISKSLPELIPTIVEVVLQIVTTLIDNIDLLINAAVDLITALAEGLIAALPILIMQAPTIISKLVKQLVVEAPRLLVSAAEIIVQLVTGIANNLFELGKSAGQIITTLVEGITEMFGSVVDVGKQVVDKIKEGISSAWQGLKNWFNSLWDGLFSNRNVNVNVNKNGYDPTGGNPSFAASGIDYVPYNRFPAILHEGEAVLTASEADAWRKGNGGAGNGVTIIQNINAPTQTPVQLASATAAYFEQARWAL